LTPRLSGRYTLVCPSHSQPLLVPFRSVPGGNGLGGRPPGSAMFISVQDLQLQEIPFQEEFSAEALELGSELRQAAPAKASGRAALVEEHDGARRIPDIRVVGKVSTRLEMRCARCLEPVFKDVNSSFDLVYRPQGADKKPDESSISEAETEIGFYQGDGLLLEDVVKEQLLLAVPLRVVCREECKGLCPLCGRNRNLEPCNCSSQPPDPRWAALEEIKNKLKQ